MIGTVWNYCNAVLDCERRDWRIDECRSGRYKWSSRYMVMFAIIHRCNWLSAIIKMLKKQSAFSAKQSNQDETWLSGGWWIRDFTLIFSILQPYEKYLCTLLFAQTLSDFKKCGVFLCPNSSFPLFFVHCVSGFGVNKRHLKYFWRNWEKRCGLLFAWLSCHQRSMTKPFNKPRR